MLKDSEIANIAAIGPLGDPPASKYERLIARAKQVPPATTVVVHPCEETALRGPIQAAEVGIIVPILVGPAAKIASVAREHGLDIGRFEIVDVPHSDAAAAKAVELIHESKGELLMKGSLHTDELMREVTSAKTGLRTARRISHVFIMDVPGYSETLFISDAAINIFPDLDAKRDIVQNAIDLFTQVGLGTPRVAILSAVETVTSKIPSTIEAAALCKMAERGQITGGILDGPLAFDNAINPEAARIKGIESEVAGRAQILIVPDLEAGNMLAKNLTFMAKADTAGIVLGARVPIILTSRADSVRSRMASCAAVFMPTRATRCSVASLIAMDASRRQWFFERKFQIFGIEASAPRRLIKGQIDGIGTRPRLAAEANDKSLLIDRTHASDKVPDVPAAIAVVASWLRETQSFNLVAVGHRVVHGGPKYDRPVLIDQAVVANLEQYVSLAPLHQPNNLAPIRTLLKSRPELLQVACFDTAFHHGHSAVADHYAIPERFYVDGVRRYGFHGLSYEYVAQRLREVAPTVAAGRVIIAHLGSGASMCALANGRSAESTMGFTALDGIPMGTRPGQIDPGVLLYLLTEKDMTPTAVQDLLYRDSGLKGLSGISNDMRDLQSSSDPRARLAVDYFVYRIGLNAGMLAAALGGLDAFVFTAGIGEKSPTIRTRIAEKLAWLGAVLDPAANADGKSLISRPESRVVLLVVPTDEELMIAHHTLALLAKHTARKVAAVAAGAS
jgi:acetate kinase